MKKISLIALALSFFVFGTIEAKAQISVKNVMDRASTAIDKLEESGAQVLYMQVDVLKRDDIGLSSYTLEAGNEYAIVAIGDADRIKDIDMAVLDSSNNPVGKDNDETNVAIVKVTPKRTQTFKFGVKGHEMTRNDGFYALIICRLN
jgi:hypothetical protein